MKDSGIKTQTVVGSDFYFRHKNLVDFLDVAIYGAGLSGVTMIIVMGATVVTAVKLRQAATWRASVQGEYIMYI